MRFFTSILLFGTWFAWGVTHFPRECFKAIWIGNWTAAGPWGRYGLAHDADHYIVVLVGPLGALELRWVVYLALSGLAAYALFVMWPKNRLEKDDGPVRFT